MEYRILSHRRRKRWKESISVAEMKKDFFPITPQWIQFIFENKIVALKKKNSRNTLLIHLSNRVDISWFAIKCAVYRTGNF